MVVRALIAVMTLAGAVPFRVCTCGAVHLHHDANPPPASRPKPDEPTRPTHPALTAGDTTPHHHHDPDCHAVKPRPAMTLAVPLALAEMPDSDLAFTLLAQPAEAVLAPGHAEAAARPPPPRGRPLFLELQVFRN